MDTLFGGVERSDVEAAVLGYGDKGENKGTVEHLEFSGHHMEGAANQAVINPPMSTIDERK